MEQNISLQPALGLGCGSLQIVGRHPLFVDVIERLKCIADKDITILLVGETGTGKELCARLSHFFSQRRNRAFIPFNCGLGPSTLFESQLFGHVRGAFTGAVKDRPGIVEEANNGVLYLDEINSLDPASQVKLNRFLETRTFRRLGENRMRQAKVRIIAASNVDLRKAINEDKFREDLYYRLSEYEVRIPPLRERRQDIRLLVGHFLRSFGKLYGNGRLGVSFSESAWQHLEAHSWPGNVRELENFVRRCVLDSLDSLDSQEKIIEPSHFPISLDSSDFSDFSHFSDFQSDGNGNGNYYNMILSKAKRQLIREFEISYLQNLLRQYDGVVAKCAKHSGKHPPDLWKLCKKYGIEPADYRPRLG